MHTQAMPLHWLTNSWQTAPVPSNYMDDFVCSTADKQVEQQFELDFQSKVVVDFMGDAEWYLGTKFDGTVLQNGDIKCHMS